MLRQQVSPYTVPIGVSIGAQWAPEQFLWYAAAERHEQAAKSQAASGTFPFNNGVGLHVSFHLRRRIEGPLAYRTGEHADRRVQPPRTRRSPNRCRSSRLRLWGIEHVSLRMRI